MVDALSLESLAGGDVDVANALMSVYDSVEDIDLWIAGLAQPHFAGSMLGETFYKIVLDQFTRSRDGDRFFYLNDWDHLLVLDQDFGSGYHYALLVEDASVQVE